MSFYSEYNNTFDWNKQQCTTRMNVNPALFWKEILILLLLQAVLELVCFSL